MSKSKRTIFFAGAAALVLLCLAIFALVPSTAWFGRTVVDAPYDDGAYLYTGTLNAGKFNGTGKIAFKDGTRYEGGFYEGAFHGAGVFHCDDKLSGENWAFDGIFEHGEPVRGTLILGEKNIVVNGESYELARRWAYIGALGLKGQRGSGVFLFEDGAKYKGECVDGLAQGQGTYIDKDGNVLYVGSWYAGLYAGEGKYEAPDGSFAYAGQFRAGKFDGKGTVMTKEGKTVAGTWKNGWRVAK